MCGRGYKEVHFAIPQFSPEDANYARSLALAPLPGIEGLSTGSSRPRQACVALAVIGSKKGRAAAAAGG